MVNSETKTNNVQDGGGGCTCPSTARFRCTRLLCNISQRRTEGAAGVKYNSIVIWSLAFQNVERSPNDKKVEVNAVDGASSKKSKDHNVRKDYRHPQWIVSSLYVARSSCTLYCLYVISFSSPFLPFFYVKEVLPSRYKWACVLC